ncbi:MAG: hypothetical protein Q4F71_09780 [Paracoccus sp. (in: a-proteobacteria)]|nr:hypothetical protein [Paracoccus sp. (in: a-proteobacteria)]
MFYIDVPTKAEINRLIDTRSPASVSIYLPTTAVTQDIDQSRIELKNLAREADQQLEEVGVDKRVRSAVQDQIEEISEDDDFWAHQATSLAIFVTPERHKTFRLPTNLPASVHVSDRLHINPLLRVMSRPDHVFILALEENQVRLVEAMNGEQAQEVRVADMPKDAASAVGKSTINDRSHSRRIAGDEGQKVRLRQYCRQIDKALRPFLTGHEEPLVVVATQPLASVYQSVSSYSEMLEEVVEHSPARMSPAELARLTRPVVDRVLADRIEAFHELYEARNGEGRATTDVSQAARAATFGAVDTMLVDIDAVLPGLVDRESGAVTLDKEDDAVNYSVVDEIAARVLRNGGQVLGVRADDIPGKAPLAAVMRYAV